jgi:hypothetical protein
MKRKRIPGGFSPGLAFLFLSGVLSAQNPVPAAEIRGVILDAKTKEAVSGTVIRVSETKKSVLSGPDGRFSITGLAPGVYTLEITAAGFRRKILKDIALGEKQPALLTVELELDLPRLTEHVSVSGRAVEPAERTEAGVRSVSTVELTRMPATIRDLSRVLNSIPGASQVTDKTNDLVVRGGSPWENGFYVDHIPIPNINHFQNQSGVGGAIGVLDVTLIDSVDFYTGGFSAAYGDRMSSIIDIQLREGSRERTGYRANLHLAGIGGSIEGPLAPGRGSFLLSARRCYYDIITKFLKRTVSPNFTDIHLKMVYDIDPFNTLTVLDIYGASTLTYDLEEAISEGLNSIVDFDAHQNTIGLNWRRAWDRGFSDTSLSYSTFRNTADVTGVNPEAASASYTTTEEGTQALVLRNVNNLQTGERSQLEFGLEIVSERFDFDNHISGFVNRWETDIPPLDARGASRNWKTGLFASWIIRPFEALSLSLGLRGDYYSLPGAWHASPRLSAAFALAPGVTAKAAWGFYYQALPLFLTAENPENRLLRDPRAEHRLAGLEFKLGEDASLTLEVYDKIYRNAPLTPDDPTLFLLDSGVDFGFYRSYSVFTDDGLARASGLELLLQKKTDKGFYGLLSASLGRTRFRDEAGVWYPRIIDYGFLVSAIGGFKAGEKWAFSGRMRLIGGRPYTPYDLERSAVLQRGIFDKTRVLAERYPTYLNVSLQVNRQFRFRRSALNVYLSLWNVLNRKNLDKYIWDRVNNKPLTIYQAPFLPEFGIEYVF